MELLAYYDDVFLEHDPPEGAFLLESSDYLAVDEPAPDVAARVQNIRHIVERELGDRTTWPAVEPATRDQLERVHDPDYLDELQRACERGERLTPDTSTSPGTFEAARHAAGAAITAARRADEDDVLPYALVRPSGHHAQPAQADGFCYINNAAVAAADAIATGRADRVAIVDWDVHHGNGTQESFYDRDDVLVVSLHNDFGSWGPHHPQSGGLEEVGTGAGEGYSVNVPLPPGTGDEGYADAFERLVEPVVAAYDPDLLLVSAGQDPGHMDPMARNLVSKPGFEELGRRVRALADAHADGALALVQEGGYQQSHIAFATLGALEGALGVETGVREPFFVLEEHPELARAWVDEAMAAHAAYWPLDG